ncbi:MAG: polysaccharide deacetylase family protein [Candidatus Omnitrophica bacterium]|nr:polysaccharide deacetylase family protein [Candidatus Omnitrophota bacterium]
MRKTKIIITVSIIIIFALCANFLLKKAYVVPILMYHSINTVCHPGLEKLTVKPDTFDRQMNFLKSQGYNVVSLEKLVAMIKDKRNIPWRTVAITFDDGYADVYRYAFPILKKYNLPATAFIIIDEVGRSEGDRLSWEQIRQMQRSGIFSIGSHAFGHEPLINIDKPEELQRQIVVSKKFLEEKLGQEVELFSYPEGFFNAKIVDLVKQAGYLGAVATNPGRKYPNNDVFILKRIRISETARNMVVFAIKTSGFYTFIKETRKNWRNVRMSWTIDRREK